jgi:hypothetical protein
MNEANFRKFIYAFIFDLLSKLKSDNGKAAITKRFSAEVCEDLLCFITQIKLSK